MELTVQPKNISVTMSEVQVGPTWMSRVFQVLQVSVHGATKRKKRVEEICLYLNSLLHHFNESELHSVHFMDAPHVQQRVIMPLSKLLGGWGEEGAGTFRVPGLRVILACACGLPPGGQGAQGTIVAAHYVKRSSKASSSSSNLLMPL